MAAWAVFDVRAIPLDSDKDDRICWFVSFMNRILPGQRLDHRGLEAATATEDMRESRSRKVSISSWRSPLRTSSE